MWGVLWYVLGCCRVCVTGASVQWALNEFARRGIPARKICHVDELHLEATILARDLPRARLAAQRAMCSLEPVRQWGLSRTLAPLKKRWGLCAALLVLVLAAAVLPRFVWFYEVSGNERVPTQKILRELDAIGVGFGTYGPSIKPQEVKNQMLCRIPELQWLTIQQSGGTAVVVVRERPLTEPVNDRRTPRNVVASRAGVLTRVAVYEGGSLCKVGDVVSAGQMLVSGYLDWGYKTQVVGALAEIYAATWRKSCTVLPDTALRKIPTGETKRAVSLLFGRRRVSLAGSSRAGENCDRTTRRIQIVLPGGHLLPVAIEISEQNVYDTEEMKAREPDVRALLERDAISRARQDMLAGTITKSRLTLRHEGGCWRLYAALECEEMIARMVNAEIFKDGIAND